MKRGQSKKIPKKNASKKGTSISELAGMVARGFTELRQETSEGFERTDGHINMVEHKVDRVQDSVNELSYESRKTRTRIENLEFKVFGSIQEP